MTFLDIPAGAVVFLDANTLIYHFTAHVTFGAACTALLDRCDRQEITGRTSAHVLAEMAHRLMTSEAVSTFAWPAQGIATRMRNHPGEVQQLVGHRRALHELSQFQIDVLTLERQHVSLAADITQQTGLLCSDAVIVAIMRQNGITALASNDADFDRVGNLSRYAPV
jgi:predicted nucleic acid-binding protein